MTTKDTHDAEAPERLDLRSPDVVADRRRELLRLFSEVATEGGELAFERLKLALGEAVDVGKERRGRKPDPPGRQPRGAEAPAGSGPVWRGPRGRGIRDRGLAGGSGFGPACALRENQRSRYTGDARREATGSELNVPSLRQRQLTRGWSRRPFRAVSGPCSFRARGWRCTAAPEPGPRLIHMALCAPLTQHDPRDRSATRYEAQDPR